MSYVVLYCPMRSTLWDPVVHRGTHVTCPMVAFRQAHRTTWSAGWRHPLVLKVLTLCLTRPSYLPVITFLHSQPCPSQGS
jgi:hypothetical protein